MRETLGEERLRRAEHCLAEAYASGKPVPTERLKEYQDAVAEVRRENEARARGVS